MPFIRNLWIASLTDNAADSDTDNRRVVMMTQGEIDVVHDDLDSRPADRGGGNVDHLDISDFGILPENYYMRIGIRGDDAWRPRMIAAWCERFTSGNVVLLGYDEEITQVLSTDSSEGRISLPLRQIGQGLVDMEIKRVMLVTSTGGGDFETTEDVHVAITLASGLSVVNHTIPDTPQADFRSGKGNLYFLPVIQTFPRSALTDRSVELSISGDDAWGPTAVMLFGLDTAVGQPTAIVPLVHVHPFQDAFGILSTDLTEGLPRVTLPLAPIDP
jgi:hypothetical protein